MSLGLVYVVLGIEPRVLCILGRHSTNFVTSPVTAGVYTGLISLPTSETERVGLKYNLSTSAHASGSEGGRGQTPDRQDAEVPTGG